MKKVKFISIVLILIFSSCNKYPKENTTEITAVDSTEVNQYSYESEIADNNTCTICGNHFVGRGFEEQMDGSWKELESPYTNQICSPSCGRKASQKLDDVADKYGIELDEQNSETNSNTQGDYHMGNDGRVYENNKCSLCKGTGIETGKNLISGETQGRICPMCDGRGVRSY